MLIRGFSVWLIIILAETLHGVIRVIAVEPFIGDLRARQTGVLVGSILILTISFVFARWIKGDGMLDFLAVGGLWIGLTLGFEIFLGRFILDLSWERIYSDYDMANGGLMLFGMLVMLFAPLIAAKFWDEI